MSQDNPFASSAYASPSKSYDSGQQPVSGMAIGALVCGILGLVFIFPGCCCIFFMPLSGILGLVGVILGIFGMQECNRTGKGGKGMAMAGLICGGVALGLMALWFVLYLLGFAVQAAGAGANQFNNNF
jgi:hypothetical protein